jgi:hypothetical protein
MFGLLFVKNLLPDIAGHNHHNHDEIGHIHFYKMHTKKISENVIKDTSSETQAAQDENCSSGKSVFSYSQMPVAFSFSMPMVPTVFKAVFAEINNFKTPYLEPKRKPPRLA